jgi:predicted RNase H-like HicB family nuclease
MKIVPLRCYVEQQDGYWQAGCIDLDIFADGSTCEDAKAALHDALESFFQTLNTLPVKDQRRLLRRKSPLSVRIEYALKHFYYYVLRQGGGRGRQDFISDGTCLA